MSAMKSSLFQVIVRQISTNNVRQTATEAISINGKETYYQKIAHKVIEDASDVKPEGWNDALPFSKVPGPKPLPIIGNVWRFMPGGEFYKASQVDLHRKLHQQYGDVAYLSGIPGKDPLLITYNPDNFEQVFRSEGVWPKRNGLQAFVYYRNNVRSDVFQGVGGVLTVHGEDWFNVRSVVNKILMQPRTAELYTSNMDEVAEDFVRNIRCFANKDPRNEMPDDFQNEIYKWSLESMGVIAYNKRLGCLEVDLDKNSTGQRLIYSGIELFRLMYELDILPSLWTYVSTRNWRKFVKILDFFTEQNQKFIEECLAKANPDPSIPDYERSVLERLTKTNKKIAIAMATDMIIAGIDTTGKSLGASLYYLSKNPDKQNELRNELKKFMPKKSTPVTKDMLKEMLYLKATIKEVLRISPAVVSTVRTSIKDLVLSGYQIPKGTEILTVPFMPSNEEKYIKRPSEFIPERWLRSTTNELSYKNIHPFATLPFGFGPRACIGKRLANLELEVALAKIIRNFDLSWNRPDPRFDIQLLYGIADPIKITVKELDN